MATGDIDRAARYLMDFVQGKSTTEAEAGALLVADALYVVRAWDGIHHSYPNGRRGI